MKTLIVPLLSVVLMASSAFAEKDHAHKARPEGPNGGRVITVVEPHLEFKVTPDRKVEIVALTEDLKPAKLSGQSISVTAGERTKPVKLEFKDEDGKLVSTNVLPEGNDFPVSVSIKPATGGKATYEKFNLNLEKCPSCKHAEYACICEHGADDKEEKK